MKKSTYSDYKLDIHPPFHKDNEYLLNKSGNNNPLNLSSNLFFENTKNFLFTNDENLTTKNGGDSKKVPTFLQNRIKTPNNLINSSDKIFKDTLYKTASNFHHKKSEQFSNKSELQTLRSLHEQNYQVS